MSGKSVSPTAQRLAKGNAISKACSVFTALSSTSPLRLNEIADITGLNRVTTLRILEDLTSAGFLIRSGSPPRYDFGSEIFAIAAAASRNSNPREVGRPAMIRLAVLSGDTVLMSIRSGAEAICVEKQLGDYPIRANFLDVGSRRPLGVGAGSMALLAALPEPERSQVLDLTCEQLDRFPNVTRSKLEERIAFYDANGYVPMYDMVIDLMGAIGIPVIDGYGNLVCSISIVGLSDRLRSRERMLVDAAFNEIRQLKWAP